MSKWRVLDFWSIPTGIFRPKCKTLMRPEASTSYRTSDAGRTTAILTYVRSAFVNSYSEYAEVVRFMGALLLRVYSGGLSNYMRSYQELCYYLTAAVLQYCHSTVTAENGDQTPYKQLLLHGRSATVKQLSSCNSSLGLSTFTVYQCSGRDRQACTVTQQAHSERYLSFRLSGEPNNTSRYKNNGIFGVDSF